MNFKTFTLGGEGKSLWCVQLGLRSRWLAICLVLFICLVNSNQAIAQQYTADFSAAPAFYAGSWPGYNTHATVNLGGVDYDIAIGQVTNWSHSSTGGESNSGSITAIGGGDINVTIKRKDNQRFQFYGVWLKYTNYSNYANKDLRVTYSGSSDPQQTFGGNSTAILSKNVNVSSVSLYFGGLDRLYLDNLIVGPAIASLPTLTTTNADNINSTFATVGGNITNDGGGTVTERGVVWATSTNPTTGNNKLAIGSGTGAFSGQITGLTANTIYYVRAYATNTAGTAYGNQVSFTTSDGTGPITLTPTLDSSFDSYGSYPDDPNCYVAYSSEYGQVTAALKFSLTPVSGTVSSAKLRLFVNTVNGTNAFAKVWSSSNENWTSSTTAAPAVNQAIGQVNSPVVGTWMEFDVTDYVKAQVNGSKVASLVVTGNTPPSPGEIYFNATENGENHPQLVITTGSPVLSSNANLSNLVLSAGTLSPAFAASTTSYTANVTFGVSSVSITATKADANATIKVNGATVASGTASSAIPLSIGSNQISITVTAQDGTNKEYTIDVTRAAPTLPQYALSFNGINQYVSVPNNAKFETTTSTVEMWVKPDWITGQVVGNPTLIGVRSSTGTRYSIHLNNGLDRLGSWNGSSYQALPYTFVQGNWYHVAAVMTAATTEFFVNGTSIGVLNIARNASVTGRNLNIGVAEIAGTNLFELFKGEIDEVRVWNTARTASEIQANYGNPISASSAGLIAYYGIEEGVTGQANAVARKVTDNTSNALHGTLYNYYSSNANLASLTLSAGTLSPVFAAGTTSYTAAVTSATTSVTITPVVADASATVTVNGTAVTSGNASQDISLNIGDNTITTLVTAQDGSTKTYTINITRPYPPVSASITAQTNVSCSGGANGSATVTVSEGTAPYAYSWSPTGGTGATATGLTPGTYTVTVTDAAGNSTTATTTIEVSDTEKPTISVPTTVTVSTDAGKSTATGIVLGTPVTADNCSVETVTNDAPATFPLGNTTVNWTVTDGAGNTATATQLVTVKDTEAPVPTIANLPTVTGECSATVTAPTATDNAAGNITGTTADPIVYTQQGTYTITWTYNDGNGNTTTQTQQVEVKDVIAPVLAAIAPITQENDLNKCGAVVIFSKPAVTDNCMVSFNYFNAGEPNDWGGSEDYIQFLYDGTWNDMPSTSEMDYVVEFNAITSASFADYNKIGDFRNRSYYVSITPKTWSDAKDAAQAIGGNLVSINTQEENDFLKGKVGGVWVGGFHDHNDIWYVEPGNASQSFGGWKWVDGTSIGTNISLTQTAGLPSGSLFPIGTTTNTFVATDAAGNKSEISFDVTVTDTQKPTVLTQNITVQLDANGAATITADQVNNGSSDNCAIKTIVLDKTAFDCSNVGQNTVTLTVTDVNGNEATATAIVTVEDKTLPTITARNITVQLDANGQATITVDQVSTAASDNCGIASISVSKTSFDCSNVGANNVTLTVTDNSGNTHTAPAIVTVVDNINPTITAPAAVVVDVDAGKNTASNVVLGNPVTADNCLVATVTNDAPATYPTGNTTVTWTVTDANGNTATAIQIVTVRRDVISVATPATVNVPIRTMFANVPLPTTVTVTYSDNSTAQIGVTWSQGNYNGLVAGNYTIAGQLILAAGTTNTGNKAASMTVVVEPNKAPTALAFSATTFAPNIKADEAIGTLSTTDPDDTQFVYTLVAGNGDKDNNLFEIQGDKVYLKSNSGLSGKTVFTFRVRSTDPYQNTIEKEFTLTKGNYGVAADKLKIVNAFSPNGDGINDTWRIPELSFYNNVEVEVFDRSGVRLFHTTDPEMTWDGRSANGQILQGAFFYIVQIKDISLVKKGVVTILKK